MKHNLLQHSILFTCVEFQELSWKKYSNFSVNRGRFPTKFKSLGNLRDDFNSDERHVTCSYTYFIIDTKFVNCVYCSQASISFSFTVF